MKIEDIEAIKFIAFEATKSKTEAKMKDALVEIEWICTQILIDHQVNQRFKNLEGQQMWERVYKGRVLHWFTSSTDTLCGKTFLSFTYSHASDLMGYKRCKNCEKGLKAKGYNHET